jgi:hypothetical protein
MIKTKHVVAYAAWRVIIGIISIGIVLALLLNARDHFQRIVFSALVMIYAQVGLAAGGAGLLYTDLIRRLHSYGLRPQTIADGTTATEEMDVLFKETSVAFIDSFVHILMQIVALVGILSALVG